MPDPQFKKNIKVLEKETFTGQNEEEITREARKYAIDNDYLAFDIAKLNRLSSKDSIKAEVSFFGRNR